MDTRLRFLMRALMLSIWLGLWTMASGHAEPVVVIVSSERSAAYVEASEALINELERHGLSRYDMRQLTALEWSTAAPFNPQLFVALGSEAARVLAKAAPQAPVLCTLLPRRSFERILLETGKKSSSQFSALYLDQPLSRQLELIRLALPTARRIGVLWGPESQGQASALKGLAQASGLKLVEAHVGRDELLFPSLKKVIEDADLLLAVADPQLYNSLSLQNILLSSFRQRVPLVAFSPAYVRAGALLALHVTPAQMGVQAAEIARAALQGKALSATPIYSQDFSVAINEHVARSLGLTLDAVTLVANLRSRENLP